MAEIRRGVVRSFDAVSYRATLQIDDSRSAFAVDVPVSRGIPAGEMVAGRACVVVLQNPDDATDAAVVAVVA